MKKITLSIFAFVPAFLVAQNSAQIKKPATSASTAVKDTRHLHYNTGTEDLQVPGSNNRQTWFYAEDAIGTTTYDLQTNSSPQRRLINYPDGSLSGTFTFGDQSGSGYPDRGAGYNYFDGTNWGSFATSRIESTRNGWPALATSGDDEIIVSHSGNGGLTLNIRPAKGTGSWVEKVIPTNFTPGTDDILWPRVAVGGANDSTLHVIALVGGTDTAARYFGLRTGAMLYYRSKNLGATWDIIDSLLPFFDTSSFTFHGGDSYAIDARKNVVAISYFPTWSDVIVVKSTDNGDSWVKHIANDFPVDKHEADDTIDLNNDGIQDTNDFFTTDGSGSILIDNNDNVHLFFGSTTVNDEDQSDGGTIWQPYNSTIAYWNESFGNDSIVEIAGYQDYDGDNQIAQLNGGAIANMPEYGVAGVSMPTCGIAADGKIFLAYVAFAELHTNGTQTFRHLYVMKTDDNGTTWSVPGDFTPDFDYILYEHVYPSMAKRVSDQVHLTYQRDLTAGTFVRTASLGASVNEIMHMSIDTMLYTPVASVEEIEAVINVSLYPNPATDIVSVKLQSKEAQGNVSLEVIDALGRTVISEGAKLNNALEIIQMDVTSLKNGAYTFIIRGEKSITTKAFIKQ